MIEMTIPGRETLRIENLVCDVNGTLAEEGRLVAGVEDAFQRLKNRVKIHMITADTRGIQDEIDRLLNCKAARIHPGGEDEQKLEFIRRLGAGSCAAIGQGTNDALMLKEAALGICVLSAEGASAAALQACDIVARDILSALALFEHPQRLQATLRK